MVNQEIPLSHLYSIMSNRYIKDTNLADKIEGHFLYSLIPWIRGFLKCTGRGGDGKRCKGEKFARVGL